MKLKLPALVLVAAMGGVASAHILMQMPQPVAALPRSKTMSPPPSVPAEVPAIAVRKASSVVQATRPPVPLLATRHSSFVSTKTASADVPPEEDAAPPASAESIVAREREAAAAIEADGYKNVRALSRGPQDVWTARAMRGATEVAVSVDSNGNVSAN